MAGVTKQMNPATGELLPSVPNTPTDAIGAIIQTARSVQKSLWSKLSFKQRAECVKKTKQFLARNADRGAEIISSCNGKTKQDALATEILPCIMACDWYIKNTHKVLKRHSLPCGNILFANKTNYLEYSPIGVVGIISPWNYPFSIPFGEIIMGLMAGNAIVLKVATPTTLVGCFIEECIQAGGFPAGLFSHIVVPGSTVSKEMFRNGIDKVFFTGSVGVGKQLMQEAAATLTPLSLELGGNDPMVVLADADIERSVNCALWAGFQNAGQSCGGIQRIYVQRKIFDAFVDVLATKTKALRHGPSRTPGDVDIGAITTKSQLATVEDQVKHALAAGARIVAQSTPVGDTSKGFFYPATVLVDVKESMRTMSEEVFGPIVNVIPFDTEDEGVTMANRCSMALTSSVFSTDTKKAKEIASRLESGVVSINDHLYTHGMSETPWGGWKESGLGRTHGYLGLKEMCNVRCVNNDLLPSTWVPRNMWWFPFTKSSYEGIKGGISFLCPQSVGDFVSGTAKLLPFAVSTMFTKWLPQGMKAAPPPRRDGQGGWIGAALKVVLPIVGTFIVVKSKSA